MTTDAEARTSMPVIGVGRAPGSRGSRRPAGDAVGGAAPRRLAVRAAITAAGEGRRMGGPKALLPWGDATILGAILRTLSRARLDGPPAVVVGAHAASVVREAARWSARCLLNERYAAGRFTSIQTAASWALEGHDASGPERALLLWPVDCPGVRGATVRALLALASRAPEENLVPVFRGRGGHPIVLCPRFLKAIVQAPPDSNLRDLLASGPVPRRPVEVDDPAILHNLNTREDYESAAHAPGLNTREDCESAAHVPERDETRRP